MGGSRACIFWASSISLGEGSTPGRYSCCWLWPEGFRFFLLILSRWLHCWIQCPAAPHKLHTYPSGGVVSFLFLFFLLLLSTVSMFSVTSVMVAGPNRAALLSLFCCWGKTIKLVANTKIWLCHGPFVLVFQIFFNSFIGGWSKVRFPASWREQTVQRTRMDSNRIGVWSPCRRTWGYLAS